MSVNISAISGQPTLLAHVKYMSELRGDESMSSAVSLGMSSLAGSTLGSHMNSTTASTAPFLLMTPLASQRRLLEEQPTATLLNFRMPVEAASENPATHAEDDSCFQSDDMIQKLWTARCVDDDFFFVASRPLNGNVKNF